MKVCFICKVEKPINEFYKHSTGKYGVAGTCKVCKKAYLVDWYAKNKQHYLQVTAQWSQNNLEKKREHRAKRRAVSKLATPSWLNDGHRLEIKSVYYYCSALRKVGLNYEVDHIVPLRGKIVSGMHVPWNLQVIPTAENRSKGNK